jgi:hypothetical protein
MLRFIALFALFIVFAIGIYLPSRVPAENFIQLMREEHAQATELWGEDVADRVLLRALSMQQAVASANPPPSEPTTAGGKLFGRVTGRFFSNQYFESMWALFAMISFRICSVLELGPLLIAFLVVASLDGWVVRKVRSKEITAPSAERFAASLAAGLLLLSAVVVAWLLPLKEHPMVILSALLAMQFALSRALANYHLLR